MFVSFEGVDGSGKTTQARLLSAWLEEQGRTVLSTREPGGTPLGERVRKLVLDGDAMSDWAEAALFAAARAEHVHAAIRPALARGEDVVCDRYLDSSVAYQGIARGLGEVAVRDLNLAVTGGLLPDRTIVVLLHPDAARGRSSTRPDRIEREEADFVQRVDDAFRRLAQEFPGRIVCVEGARTRGEIAEEIREHVRPLL